MDIEVKKRLRAVVASESISNIDIAKKTGYSQYMVSISLNTNNDTLTDKFLRKFFDAYPDVKEKYREYILEGTGNGSNLFANAIMSDTQIDARLGALEKENKMLREQNELFQKEISWFKTMLERAFAIQPDLQGKLLNPLAQLGQVEPLEFNMPQGDYKGGYAHA